MQLHSERMELYQANQLSDHSQREKSRLCTELNRKGRLLQEDRTRSLQEIDELKKMCCTEPEKESKSTVNQLMVQIQELQGWVNSLNDAFECFDPETASSYGSPHVPSQPMSIPSPCGLISRDSCLQLATRNSCGTSGHFFEDQSAPSELPAAFFGNSRSMASAPCELVSRNKGRLAERPNELERNLQNFAIPTPRFARKFSTCNPPSHVEGAYLQNLHG